MVVGYMNFSSISKPRLPLAYSNTRNYSNGSKSVTAHSIKAEAISQLVEKRLKIVEEMRASNAKPADKNAEKRSGAEDEEDFDESKVIRPKESDKLKPNASIINIAPDRVSEILIKN